MINYMTEWDVIRWLYLNLNNAKWTCIPFKSLNLLSNYWIIETRRWEIASEKIMTMTTGCWRRGSPAVASEPKLLLVLALVVMLDVLPQFLKDKATRIQHSASLGHFTN